MTGRRRPALLASLSASLLLVAAACGGGGGGGGGGDDAGVEVDAGPDAGPPGPGSDYIFDVSRLHHFDVELSDADWQWLKDNALLEQYKPATLIFEGQRYEGAAITFKGSYGTLESCIDETGTQICPKLSIKISMNEYGDGRFFGLRKLIFNSSVRDPSLMHEFVGYHLFREMGVPAPRATHATLTVNGEELGLYVLVEPEDKEFVQDHFTLDDGNLYKAVWPIYGTQEPYIEALHTNEDAPNVSDMMSFHDRLAATTDETFSGDFAGLLDMDKLARYLAVDRVTSNDDGMSTFYCYGQGSTECTNANYYWYSDPSGEMVLLPWDLDYALYDVGADLGRAQQDPNPNDCQAIRDCVVWGDPCDPDQPAEERVYILPPQCDKLYGLVHRATWSQYLVELENLASGPLARDAIVPWVQAERDKIADTVASDPLGPDLLDYSDNSDWLDHVLESDLDEIAKLLAEQ